MLSFSHPMFKELLLTTFLGIVFGFGLTGGFIALKKSGKISPPSSNQPTPTQIISPQTSGSISPTPTITPEGQDSLQGSHQISIESPENESITNNSKVEIRGSTTANSFVVIKTSTKTYSAKADKNGQFNTYVDLESGANLVEISSFDPQDNQAETQLLITYSTAKI